jgi:hypothetical protein
VRRAGWLGRALRLEPNGAALRQWMGRGTRWDDAHKGEQAGDQRTRAGDNDNGSREPRAGAAREVHGLRRGGGGACGYHGDGAAGRAGAWSGSGSWSDARVRSGQGGQVSNTATAWRGGAR